MPKTAVQSKICDICGADVRDGSLFCYNCGGSLHQAAETDSEPPARSGSAPPVNGAAKPSAEERRTAKRRKVERGPVEVVWEPREGLSIPFVVGAFLLLFIAVFLFAAAMWLK